MAMQWAAGQGPPLAAGRGGTVRACVSPNTRSPVILSLMLGRSRTLGFGGGRCALSFSGSAGRGVSVPARMRAAGHIALMSITKRYVTSPGSIRS